MTAEEIDSKLACQRWVAYPLLVNALKDAMWAFAVPEDKDELGERFRAIDRAAQLLILLGEQNQLAPSCCDRYRK